MNVFEAIDATATAGGSVIEFYPGQDLENEQSGAVWDHNASEEAIKKVQAKLKEKNILAISYGVIPLPNDEAECRKVFEFAKKMGIRTIVSEPEEAAMDLIEKLVKEYDVQVAIHDHPQRTSEPGYKHWDPNYVLSLIVHRDRRIGACADTGHWVRSGLEPVECLRVLNGRILDCHLKDLNRKSPESHEVPYGSGVLNTRAFLEELRRQKYSGAILVEYEHDSGRLEEDVAKCVAFAKE
jgi:sugar phosphate isomerase/epimerase